MKFNDLYCCLAENEHVEIDIIKIDGNCYPLEYYGKDEIDIDKLKDMEVINVVSTLYDYDANDLYLVLKQ